jgi:D-alanyl-D-alanine carboxypeptidase
MSEDIGPRRSLFRFALTAQYIAHRVLCSMSHTPFVYKLFTRLIPILALSAVPDLMAGLPIPVPSPAANLESFIETFARDHDFSGTILVQENSDRKYARSFGLADRAFNVPADSNTRYKIASITKLFTSVLVLQLRDEGKLDLNGNIKKYLADYAGEGADAITIHHLLNHTSGLPQYDNVASYQEAFNNGVEQYQKPLSPELLLKRVSGGKLTGKPGAKFNYNNADYFVLGRIIERLDGKSYEQSLTERILRPLGLKETGMLHWDAILERLAPTYFYRDDTKQLINDMPLYHENWYAAAGMYSTVADLLTFADALFGGRLIKPESLEKLLTPGVDEYGYGLWSYSFTRDGKKYKVAKRPGSVMGANGVLYRLLDRNATIILLSNTNRTDLDVFAQKIADMLVK